MPEESDFLYIRTPSPFRALPLIQECKVLNIGSRHAVSIVDVHVAKAWKVCVVSKIVHL